MLIIVMGVSGSGKTTVGEALAAALDWPFYDADYFHSEANVAKMSRGEPLTDEDREGWLDALAAVLREHAVARENAILACSALKQRYRDRLHVDDSVRWVYLHGDFDVLLARMEARTDHYMKPNMLVSQFEALEAPQNAVVIDVRAPVAEMVTDIRKHLDIY